MTAALEGDRDPRPDRERGAFVPWLLALCLTLIGCGTSGSPAGGSGASGGSGDDGLGSWPAEVIDLQYVDAYALAYRLQEAFGDEAEFFPDEVTNAMTVFANQALLDEIVEIALEVDVYDNPEESILRCSATDSARQPVQTPQSLVGIQGAIPLDYRDVPLPELAAALSRDLGLDVIHDERLQGTGSVVRSDPVPPAEAFSAFAAVFAEAGLTIVEGDSGELKIFPSDCLQLSAISGRGVSERETRMAQALASRGPRAVICLGAEGKEKPDLARLGLEDGTNAPRFPLDFPAPLDLIADGAAASAETERSQTADLPRVVDEISNVLITQIRYPGTLHGRVSLLTPEPVTAARAYELLESALVLQGFGLYQDASGELEIQPDRCIRVGGDA